MPSELLSRGINISKMKEDGKEAEWKAMRRGKITGSIAASCLGRGFATPFEAWGKIREVTYHEETPEQTRGKLMERGLLESYSRRSGYTLTDELYFEHPKHPWLAVTVDAIACQLGDDFEEHPVRGVEAKSAGEYVADHWYPGEAQMPVIPDYYEIQARLGMACTGLPQWDFNVFIEGDGEYTLPLYRDQNEEDHLIGRLKLFYDKFVVTGEPPPMSPVEEIAQAAKEPVEDTFIPATPEMIQIIQAYVLFGNAENENKKFKETKREAIILGVGSAAGYELPNGQRVKVARETRSSLDETALQGHIDDLYRTLTEKGWIVPEEKRVKIPNFYKKGNPFFKIYVPKTRTKK